MTEKEVNIYTLWFFGGLIAGVIISFLVAMPVVKERSYIKAITAARQCSDYAELVRPYDVVTVGGKHYVCLDGEWQR